MIDKNVHVEKTEKISAAKQRLKDVNNHLVKLNVEREVAVFIDRDRQKLQELDSEYSKKKQKLEDLAREIEQMERDLELS